MKSRFLRTGISYAIGRLTARTESCAFMWCFVWGVKKECAAQLTLMLTMNCDGVEVR